MILDNSDFLWIAQMQTFTQFILFELNSFVLFFHVLQIYVFLQFIVTSNVFC